MLSTSADLHWVSSDCYDASADQIEDLCAAGATDRESFYGLPTDQFCGQISSAVDLVLVGPKNYPDFFAALTSGDSPTHQDAVKAFVGLQLGKTLKIKDSDRYGQLRTNVSNYAQRALDGLQLDAQRRWKRQLLFAAIQVSIGISLAIVFVVSPPAQCADWFRTLYSTAVCGTAGALLAPFAYDITSAIRRLGKR